MIPAIIRFKYVPKKPEEVREEEYCAEWPHIGSNLNLRRFTRGFNKAAMPEVLFEAEVQWSGCRKDQSLLIVLDAKYRDEAFTHLYATVI